MSHQVFYITFFVSVYIYFILLFLVLVLVNHNPNSNTRKKKRSIRPQCSQYLNYIFKSKLVIELLQTKILLFLQLCWRRFFQYNKDHIIFNRMQYLNKIINHLFFFPIMIPNYCRNSNKNPLVLLYEGEWPDWLQVRSQSDWEEVLTSSEKLFEYRRIEQRRGPYWSLASAIRLITLSVLRRKSLWECSPETQQGNQ